MSILPTGYIVNNINYVNKDLSQIFTPLTVGGSYEILFQNGFDQANFYYGWAKVNRPRGDYTNGTNSFTTTNNNTDIVQTGIDGVGIGNSSSYLGFTKPGRYRMDFTIGLISQGNDPTDGGGVNYYMRLNNNMINQDTYYDTFWQKFANLSYSGASYDRGDDKLVDMMSTNSGDTNNYNLFKNAYLRFFIPTYYNSDGTIYANQFGLSVTLEITSADISGSTGGLYKVYPQIATGSNNPQELGLPWILSGYWSVTKLY